MWKPAATYIVDAEDSFEGSILVSTDVSPILPLADQIADMISPAYLLPWILSPGVAQAGPLGRVVNTTPIRTVGKVVNTTSGLIVGHAADGASDVSEYLGIPYAQPPINSLRFQPPQEYTSRKVFNATSYGFVCPQSDPIDTDSFASIPNLTAAGLPMLQRAYGLLAGESEDCLTLNVWSKTFRSAEDEPGKAVMFFIPGGDLENSGSASPYTVGQYLADQEDVVVVTFNYRLGILGFPGNPSSTSNLGLRDQRMALEWVRDNIAGFGGDAARITVVGQSSGANTARLLSYAFADDPIAAGFIFQSGTPDTLPTQADAADMWLRAADIAGCGANTTTATDETAYDAVFACMQTAPVDALINGTELVIASSDFGVEPTIDDELVFDDYPSRAPAAVPVLVGNNDWEPGVLRALIEGYPDEVWIASQDNFTCSAAFDADQAKKVAPGEAVWRYRWFGAFPNTELTVDPPSGAYHGSEVSEDAILCLEDLRAPTDTPLLSSVPFSRRIRRQS